MIGRLQAPGDDEDEEEMLRRAIAMSLEEEEEGEVAEGGITRVEVGAEGLHFIRNNQQGELSKKMK